MLAGNAAHATAINWTGATTDLWSATGSWSTAAVPTSSDDLTILGPSNAAGALTINVDTNGFANSINVTNTAATALTNTTSGANKTLTLGTGGLTTGSGAVSIGSATALQNINIALGGSQTWNVGSGGLTATNVISGSSFILTKSGAGMLTLSGTNTYSGGTIVNGGTFAFGNNTAAGGGKITLNGGILNTALTANQNIVNDIEIGTGSNQINIGATNKTPTFTGILSGSGNLSLNNGGTSGASLQVQMTNSMTSGTITIANNANDIVRVKSANFGNANVAWVVNAATAKQLSLEFGTGTISFGSLTGSGAIGTIAGTTATISVGALNLNDSFSGVISNAAGTAILTKVGSGTLTLSGANTYTGATIINAGTLALGAANRIADTSNIVLGGGTLAAGTFSDTIGTLSLTANSSITLGTGSSLVFADSHLLDWSTNTLSITGTFTDSLSIRFGTDASGLTAAQLALISINGSGAALDSSGFLTISAIPEPSTYAAIAGVLALGAVIIRRRSRQA